MAYAAMRDLGPGDLVLATDMDTIRGNIEYLLDPNQDINAVLSNYTVTSTSWVDLDATNYSITITTYGGPLLITFSGAFAMESTQSMGIDIEVDGTRIGVGADYGLAYFYNEGNTISASDPLCFAQLVDVAAGSHTIRIQWKVTGSTGRMWGAASGSPVGTFSAIEL